MFYKCCLNFKPTVQPVREIIAKADFLGLSISPKNHEQNKSASLTSRKVLLNSLYNLEN